MFDSFLASFDLKADTNITNIHINHICFWVRLKAVSIFFIFNMNRSPAYLDYYLHWLLDIVFFLLLVLFDFTFAILLFKTACRSLASDLQIFSRKWSLIYHYWEHIRAFFIFITFETWIKFKPHLNLRSSTLIFIYFLILFLFSTWFPLQAK